MIRAPKKTDLPAIKAIIDSNGLFNSQMLDSLIKPFLKGNKDDDIWFVMAEKGKSATAFIFCESDKMSEGTYYNKLLAVDPSVQGKGYGKKLMTEVEEYLAKKKQARIMIVETSGGPEYEVAREFYQAIGFKEEARIRDFYAEGEDKVVYTKKIVIEVELSC